MVHTEIAEVFTLREIEIGNFWYNLAMNLKEVIMKLYQVIPEHYRKKLVLVGSVNLYLQGISITPKKDIDFATDYETVQELNKLFGDLVTRFCPNRNGDNYLPFTHLFINVDGWEIEFFDAVDYKDSYYFGLLGDENTKVLFQPDVKGLNLEQELVAYKKSGKEEKIRLLEKHLNTKI